MARAKSLLLKARKTIQDLDLLKVVQSEIHHELTSKRFQNDESGSLGEFTVDSDLPHTQDVILRKKSKSGEEIAVSALLGLEITEGAKYPREILMKVCVKKPGLSSILQFDCNAFNDGLTNSEFNIHNAHYIPSVSCLDSSLYKGPVYSDLDPALQDELHRYVKSRGISGSLTDFLILYLHKKEQAQYVDWLHKLENFISSQSDEDLSLVSES